MIRTAHDVMLKDFPFVDCDATVFEAEECFERGDLTALPVLNPDRTIFGLLTPKHFAAFHRRAGSNARATRAWEICDTRPLVGARTDGLRDIASALVMDETRHVLIVNAQQQLIGVVSIEMVLKDELAILADHESGTSPERATTGKRPRRA